MKSTLFTLAIFAALVFYINSNTVKSNHYLQNAHYTNSANESFNESNINLNCRSNHKLINSILNKIIIECVYFDDYNKVNDLITHLAVKDLLTKKQIAYDCSNIYQLNLSFSDFTQSQKSIQSEFLLI